MNLEEVSYSIKNLWERRTRSVLTVLSILMGITAIFTLMSFGEGMKVYMDVLADEVGADKLFIQSKGIGAPGTDENFYISKDEIDFVDKIKGTKDVNGFYMKIGELKFKKELRYGYLLGFSPDDKEFMEEVFTVSTIKGRSLENGDLNKITLGYNYQLPKKVFDKPLAPGDKIQVNGNDFEVVGFYDEIGGPDDNNMYLLDEAFEILYPESKDKYAMVMLRSDKSIDPQDLAEKIEDKLRKYKGQDEGKEDFFVETFADALEQFGIIINVINSVLILIALVSVIVASVNIMNTMYTAVLERTKEIGIMKAIGARNSKILFIFVFESGFLGLVGGALGVVLGYFISSFGGSIAAMSGLPMLQPVFPPALTIGCILFATTIVAVSGFLPAL